MYGFVQDARVTSFTPLTVVAHKLGWGHCALTWTETKRAEPCRFGPHYVLRHLSKKVANFLHEYDADQLISLALPLLPSFHDGTLRNCTSLTYAEPWASIWDMGHFCLELRYYYSCSEDFVCILPPGVEVFVLAPGNGWYCQVRLLFAMLVKVDTSEDPIEMKWSFISLS